MVVYATQLSSHVVEPCCILQAFYARELYSPSAIAAISTSSHGWFSWSISHNSASCVSFSCLKSQCVAFFYNQKFKYQSDKLHISCRSCIPGYLPNHRALPTSSISMRNVAAIICLVYLVQSVTPSLQFWICSNKLLPKFLSFFTCKNQHQTGEKDTQSAIFRSSIMSTMVFR